MPKSGQAGSSPRAPYGALSFIAMGVLMMQVSLTRVFSLLIWYHFAFLAISLALLGFTGGGVIVSFYPAVREGDVARRLARLSFGFAAYAVIALTVACRLDFEGSVLQDAKHVVGFATLVLVVVVPFVMAGVIVAATLASYPRFIGKLHRRVPVPDRRYDRRRTVLLRAQPTDAAARQSRRHVR